MTLFAGQRPSAAATPLNTLIAEGVEVTGDVCFAGGMRIDGRVKGNLIGHALQGQALALLVISATGHVEGTVTCSDAVIDGTVVGDLDIANFLELQSNSKVCGAIRYGQLLMDAGASVCGRLFKTESSSATKPVLGQAADPVAQPCGWATEAR